MSGLNFINTSSYNFKNRKTSCNESYLTSPRKRSKDKSPNLNKNSKYILRSLEALDFRKAQQMSEVKKV